MSTIDRTIYGITWDGYERADGLKEESLFKDEDIPF